MSLHLPSRAALCQLLSIPVFAIALGGCGGVTTTSSPGHSSLDSGAPDAATGCPSVADINSKAALGQACAPEGLYCTNQACDPCVQNCPAVACTDGVWTPAVNSALCTAEAGPPPGDSSPAPCPSIDGSGFDQSCQSDSDCVAVTAGSFCAGAAQCLCGLDAINVKDQSQYEQQLATLEAQNPPGAGGCMCPYFGSPHCIAHHCAICGGAGPTCPDAGF